MMTCDEVLEQLDGRVPDAEVNWALDQVKE